MYKTGTERVKITYYSWYVLNYLNNDFKIMDSLPVQCGQLKIGNIYTHIKIKSKTSQIIAANIQCLFSKNHKTAQCQANSRQVWLR